MDLVIYDAWSPFMIKTHDNRVDQVYIDHSESAFPREDKISTLIFFSQANFIHWRLSGREAGRLYGNVKSLYFVKATVLN